MNTVNRRNFIKTLGAGAVSASLPAWGCIVPSAIGESSCLTKPLPRQIRWQDYELGLLYHYDLDVFMPGGHKHERSRRVKLDMNLFNPDKLDTDQWLAAAREMGCGYAIFTATHHQGFLQWQSDAYPFGLKQVKWRGGKADIVGDFVKSCHKYGIAPGIYIGIRFNAHWQVYNYKIAGGDQKRLREYMHVCEQMVTELCSRYGDLCEIWFDGGVLTPQQGGPDLLPIVDKYQPHAVFYHSPQRAEHRWAGNEAGTAGYPCWATIPDIKSQYAGHSDPQVRKGILRHGDPDGKAWCPAMCDAPIREHDWLWVPNHENRLQSTDRLMNMYYNSVGRNANLIIGAVPGLDGLIPKEDFQRYVQFGREIRRRFAQPLAQATGTGTMVELPLKQPARIEHVIIMEDIKHGERIRAYEVTGLRPGNNWEKLAEGISVGHKRIHRFPPIEVARLRLKITRSQAKPLIRQFAAFPAI